MEDNFETLLASVLQPSAAQALRPASRVTLKREDIRTPEDAMVWSAYAMASVRLRLGQQFGAAVAILTLATWCALGTDAEIAQRDVPYWQLGEILGPAPETVRDDIGGENHIQVPGVLRTSIAVVPDQARRKSGDPRLTTERPAGRIAGMRYVVKIPEGPLELGEALDERRLSSRKAPLKRERDLSLAVHERDTWAGELQKAGKPERAVRGRSWSVGTGALSRRAKEIFDRLAGRLAKQQVMTAVEHLLEVLAAPVGEGPDARGTWVRALGAQLAALTPESDVRGWYRVGWDALRVSEVGLANGVALVQAAVLEVFVRGADATNIQSRGKWLMRLCRDALSGPVEAWGALRVCVPVG